MSINNSYRIQIIESDGETTRYNFECFIYKKEDLKIKVMDDKANITELEYGNDYNVENQFDYYNGGYFNLAEPQKKGIYIVIYRETPIDQQINFMSLQAISPMNLTKMFDKLTVICQELNEQFYRSMKFDFTDISLIEQDKPLDETNIKNIDKELNNDYIVALTLKYNQETNKWELATSKTNPDEKREQGTENDYGVYKIATTEETKIGEDDTKIITPLKLKNGIDDRIATQDEAVEGINDKKYITPKTVNEIIKSYIADTETSLTGEDNIKYITPKTVNKTIKNYIATKEESIEGINDIKYITPNTLKTTTDDRLNELIKETIITNTIFQYKAETNYSIGQPCYALVNNEPVFYYSIKDNNIGNNPITDTEGNYWKQLKFGGDGGNLPIGSIITSTIPITDANLHLADGAKIAYDGVYKEFYDYMKIIYDNIPFIGTKYYYTDNFTIVGSLNNNSYTFSGFKDQTNYLNLGKFYCENNPWSIVVCFKLSGLNTWERLIDITKIETGKVSFVLTRGDDNRLHMYISSDGYNYNIVNNIAGSTILQTNINYYLKAEFTGTNYNVYLSDNPEQFENPDITLNSSTAIFNNDTDIFLLLGTDYKTTLTSSHMNITLFDTETNTNLTYYTIAEETIYPITINSYETKEHTFCTEEEYEEELSKTGNCGKYVLIENEYIRLPTINGWIENIADINNNGKTNEAGLPNITGKFGGGTNADQIGTYWKESAEGAFYNAGWLVNYMVGKGVETKDRYTRQRFDASRSNDIYGNSDTVTPRGIKYLVYIVLGTTKNANVEIEIEIDINNITNDINNLSNRIHIEDTYTDDNGNWYRKYSDGWVEQGGKLETSSNCDIVVNLLVPYINTNYGIYKNIGQSSTEAATFRTLNIYNKTTTTFSHSSTLNQLEATWYAFGYYR